MIFVGYESQNHPLLLGGAMPLQRCRWPMLGDSQLTASMGTPRQLWSGKPLATQKKRTILTFSFTAHFLTPDTCSHSAIRKTQYTCLF
jgi:hypothetical protein